MINVPLCESVVISVLANIRRHRSAYAPSMVVGVTQDLLDQAAKIAGLRPGCHSSKGFNLHIDVTPEFSNHMEDYGVYGGYSLKDPLIMLDYYNIELAANGSLTICYTFIEGGWKTPELSVQGQSKVLGMIANHLSRSILGFN